jgi:Fe-S cluster assembly iron-binding protein IscA
MVQITERAHTELQRLLTDHLARPQQGVRLRLNKAGDLGMTIDVPHAGDSIIRRDNLLVLIVEGRLAARLAMRVLDFPSTSGGGGGFTLGWRTPPAERAWDDEGRPW